LSLALRKSNVDGTGYGFTAHFRKSAFLIPSDKPCVVKSIEKHQTVMKSQVVHVMHERDTMKLLTEVRVTIVTISVEANSYIMSLVELQGQPMQV
jgi:hypothetical protein